MSFSFQFCGLVLLTSFIAGFGWALGAWVCGRLVRRPA
jgi:hypothetical protein